MQECSLVVLCNMESIGEDMPHGMDTTIYLVQKVATAPGSPSSKWTGMEESESVQAEKNLVEKVYADSRRLRECSKYFETCMDDRWACSKPPSSRLEFHLELQADVVYYRDCFSRMEPGSLFQPIPSVHHCLELLKVASQIVFQEVVDLGIKYLSATPWSADDGVKIRRFCESGHISLDSEAHADLIARLRKSLREKRRGEVLSLYLEHALSMRATPEIRRVFEETFKIIVSGPNRHAVIESVQKEAGRLLFSFINNDNYNNESFAWLYGVLRSVHADQQIVDLLLKDFRVFLQLMCDTDLNDWIKLIGGMLQDVLDGRLFSTEKTHGEVLSLYLEHVLLLWLEPDDRRVFEELFQISVCGPNRHAVIESVKKEATKLLFLFKKADDNFKDNIENFAWLYGLLRSVHAAQSIVDHLMKERDIFESIFQYTTPETCGQEYYMVWIKLIGGMLQDVLDGRLFLTSLERYTLFTAWRKTCEINSEINVVNVFEDLRELFTTFLMTLPFQEQKRMMESWDGSMEKVVNEVYGKWTLCLVNDFA